MIDIKINNTCYFIIIFYASLLPLNKVGPYLLSRKILWKNVEFFASINSIKIYSFYNKVKSLHLDYEIRVNISYYGTAENIWAFLLLLEFLLWKCYI